MRKPTLEEVNEYFKDANKVKSIYGTTGVFGGGVHFDEDCFYSKKENSEGHLALWHECHGYAKILSYKTPRFEITKEQILHLSGAFGNPNSNLNKCLKEWFPEAFGVELTVGKWYKGNSEFESLICITELSKESNSEREYTKINYYGFLNGNYKKESAIANLEHELSLREATPEEVKEALIAEAVKRGLTKGKYCSFGISYREGLIDSDDYFYDQTHKVFLCGSNSLMDYKGKWAEIIPTITKAEAELQLNAKII